VEEGVKDINSVNPGQTERKPTGRELRAEAHRMLAAAHAKLAEAELLEDDDVPVRAAMPVVDGALVDKKTLAAALALSTITVDRMCREGAPFEMVNARRRFDLAKVKAWCAARGQKTSHAGRAEEDDPIDISSIVRRAGFRVVGKAR
jgi:hypothetical protein